MIPKRARSGQVGDQVTQTVPQGLSSRGWTLTCPRHSISRGDLHSHLMSDSPTAILDANLRMLSENPSVIYFGRAFRWFHDAALPTYPSISFVVRRRFGGTWVLFSVKREDSIGNCLITTGLKRGGQSHAASFFTSLVVLSSRNRAGRVCVWIPLGQTHAHMGLGIYGPLWSTHDVHLL